MMLPEDLENKLIEAIYEFEEESKMPYITYVERRGFEQGEKQVLLESIAMGLKFKFGVDGERELTKIRNIKDTDVLREINVGIITDKSLDEISKIYEQFELSDRKA